MTAQGNATDLTATLLAAAIPSAADPAIAPLREVLPAGAAWSALLRRGTLLELTDLEGDGTAALTLLRADLTAERLNLPDSMKAQKISRVLEGTALMSDMGRAMATVVEDSTGGHDPIGGLTDEAGLRDAIGRPSSYQHERNHRWVSGRTMMLVELEKHGLGKADLSDVVQLFSVLDVAGDGALTLRHSGAPGARVVLRIELDVLAIVHVGPHPYDDAPAWPGGAIGVSLHRAAIPLPTEPARTLRAQTARSIERSDRAAAWAPRLAPGLAAGDGLADAPAPIDLRWIGPAPHTTLPEAVRGEAVPGGRTLAGDPIVLPPAIEPPAIDGPIRLDDVIDSGDGWLRRVEAGEVLRIVDLEGNQAADTVFFCAERPAEVRYSWTATIAGQHNPYLTTGSVIRATEGEPFATITADTVGKHDTCGGACARESNVVRYGEHTRYQHACRDTFVRELIESGLPLGKRDLTANINFFMHVPIDSEGGLDFADGLSGPGQWFELTFHRPTWVLISNCPQINNPCNAFDPTPIRAQVYAPAANGEAVA